MRIVLIRSGRSPAFDGHIIEHEPKANLKGIMDRSNRGNRVLQRPPGGTRNTIEYVEKKMIEVVKLRERTEETTENSDP